MRQSHLIRITIIGALLAAAAFAGIRLDGQAARALTNCSVSDISLDGEEQAFLTLVNNYRAQNGLGALSLSTNLNRASHWLGGDMGAKRYFSHTDSLGRSPSQRAIDCGYPQGAGENIAAGTVWDTAAEVFQAWRNSSGHNANMLNSSYRQIGIARVFVSGSPYGYYWVTDFGQTNDGTNGSGGGGSTATATPSPTPPPATTSGPASVALPASGSTLSGSSASFSWLAASGALEYFFYAGLSTGDNSLYAASTGTNRSVAVSNLPVDGRTIYVRLWTRFSNGWQYSDTTYRAATQSVATTSTKAVLTSPSAGSTLPSGTVTFRWTAATGALQYYFYLGTSQGSNNIFSRSFTASSTSLAMTGLPEDGRTLWVRLWTRSNSGWQYNDYWFRAP